MLTEFAAAWNGENTGMYGELFGNPLVKVVGMTMILFARVATFPMDSALFLDPVSNLGEYI